MANHAKILIIDDEPSICSGCQMILSEQEYFVEISCSGEDGLKKISDNNFDLVLLDIRLPDMSGLDILKKINIEQIDISVIIMTGHGTVANAVEAMKHGAFDFITKPFAEDKLIHTIKKALESRKLIKENIVLKKQLYDKFSLNNIIGHSTAILDVFKKIEKVAPTDCAVLLEGESGTGKELFANSVHIHSKRSDNLFLAIDCSTLSSSILESELFGHIKGAFTGADRNKPGIFEMASEGTLFLDEIANLNMDIQGKLLRVLETGEFKPLGSDKIKKTNARLVAATNRNLEAMVKEGKFREDLFYRLNVFPIYIPPLRERKDDIPEIAYHFLKLFCRKTGKDISGFSDDALEVLVNFDWPGNIRQLKNVVERLIIMSDGNCVNRKTIMNNIETKQQINMPEPNVPNNINDLKLLKKRLIESYFGTIEESFLKQALEKSNWNITKAAKKVGMQRSNFSVLMKKHGIKSPL